MRTQNHARVHLTYCLNVHPGETWEENFEAIRTHALAVRALVAPRKRFGLGLRLSNVAAQELVRRAPLAAFRRFLDEQGLYVFTINGFPFGTFHGSRVKENVYRPDWTTRERLDYTLTLAEILEELLPEGVTGSISTVPGSYKSWIRTGQDVDQLVRMLSECAERLDELHRETGKDIALALEPEPDCFIETTQEAIDFLRGPLAGYGGCDAETIFRRIGVCVDTCHLALQFEDPAEGIRRLADAGVRVAKVQISAALRCRPTKGALSRLRDFCDPVYLHQVKARDAKGNLRSWPDLAEALDAPPPARPGDEEWRVHFHVPLFFEREGDLESTASTLGDDFWKTALGGVTSHLEIETYTFAVLPPELREGDVTHNIAKEYEWVMAKVGRV
jgi:sugar phosphate isomerase/epimerase